MIIIIEEYTSTTPTIWHVQDEPELRTALVQSYDLEPHTRLNEALDSLPEYIRFDGLVEAVEALDDPRAFKGSIECYDKLIHHLKAVTPAEYLTN